MKAALHNLGCKVNAYETEAMQQILEEAGYEIVPFSEYADVYVINTCSVTNMADRKSRQCAVCCQAGNQAKLCWHDDRQKVYRPIRGKAFRQTVRFSP